MKTFVISRSLSPTQKTESRPKSVPKFDKSLVMHEINTDGSHKQEMSM